MSRTTTRRMPLAAGPTESDKYEIQQFARRLYDLMTARNWSQSDLAREAFGTTTDYRGYKVAKNRDRISAYLRGKAIPDPKNLNLLAKAFGITPEELAPDLAATAIERENPEMAMTMVSGHPDKVLLRINKLVPLPIAVRVLSLISDSEASPP